MNVKPNLQSLNFTKHNIDHSNEFFDCIVNTKLPKSPFFYTLGMGIIFFNKYL